MEVGRNNKHWGPLVRCRHTHAVYRMTIYVCTCFSCSLYFSCSFLMLHCLYMYVNIIQAPLSILCILHTYYIYPHMYVHLCLNVKLMRNPYVLWSCWPRSPGAQREKEAKEAKAKAVGVPKAIRIYTYGCFRK